MSMNKKVEKIEKSHLIMKIRTDSTNNKKLNRMWFVGFNKLYKFSLLFVVQEAGFCSVELLKIERLVESTKVMNLHIARSVVQSSQFSHSPVPIHFEAS